ncbi:MAG: sodium:solute symporter [Bernardetiaceae bacterium]
MTSLDWSILIAVQVFIIAFGIWKSRGSRDMKGYLLSNRDTPWFTVGLSIMATQASAITFLSAPGQAYTDGMRFIHIYLGMPLAMIVLSVAVVPIYHRMNVYTAYEYLEKRFDLPTRLLAAFLFLSQRGLAAGFTIFAPALVLSSLLGWNIYGLNLAIGLAVILYTVSGGTKAVSQTQKQQMAVILIGMVLAGVLLVRLLPESVSFGDALHIAGKMERLNAIDFTFDLSSKYNIWSGILGGFFLMLSYFGTDQSQVQRYLSGKSIGQSRLGLLFNAMIKIPMQFSILFIGAMLYVFYIFEPPPLTFNRVQAAQVAQSPDYQDLMTEHQRLYEAKKNTAFAFVEALHAENTTDLSQTTATLKALEGQQKALKAQSDALIEAQAAQADTNDTNYIFIHFVQDHLPSGLLGLIVAVILSASMSSTSSELNALASTTIIDFYKRLIKPEASDRHYLWVSRLATAFWGGYAILFAFFANRLGTLIEAVNVLGSLVYGTILGIFLVAFFVPTAKARHTFWAAVASEIGVLTIHGLNYLGYTQVPYLWYNVIGCLPVVALAWALSQQPPKDAAS